MNKRILVTGGAGFLGSHLIDRLLENDNTVICLDNLFTGNKKNIAQHQNNSRLQFEMKDVVTPYAYDVDQIYNLACPASPIHYQKDPIFTLKTSIYGSINALDLAKKNQAKIFQASTSEVYGDPEIHPQREDYWGHVNPSGIRSCYDEGKRCAETLFFDYQRQFNLNIKVARIFNTYGPRMDPKDGRVVSNFMIQALTGQDITIYGEGQQTRSFCYVDDLITGFLALMNFEGEISGPMNLGNPNEFTILELAEKVVSLTKSKSKIKYSILPQDDPQMRCPDISLAKSTLNWQPKIELEEGLDRTCTYFKSLI